MLLNAGAGMEGLPRPKPLPELPPVDIVVTMGCNAACPYLSCKHREDWGLDDPTGKSDEEFTAVIRGIENKIRLLANRIRCGGLQG